MALLQHVQQSWIKQIGESPKDPTSDTTTKTYNLTRSNMRVHKDLGEFATVSEQLNLKEVLMKVMEYNEQKGK